MEWYNVEEKQRIFAESRKSGGNIASGSGMESYIGTTITFGCGGDIYRNGSHDCQSRMPSTSK